MKKPWKLIAALMVVATGPVLVACDPGNNDKDDQVAKTGGAAAVEEAASVAGSFSQMTKNQSVPEFDWSQVRQTVIDVETAQAQGAVSTTAFYLEGIGLVEWCPSIGSPVASTTQLSAESQWVDIPGDESRERFSIQQGEPTGVYPGQSTGTWTICLDNNGKKFAHYWEGYVSSTIGVRKYDTQKRITIEQSTFNFKDKK